MSDTSNLADFSAGMTPDDIGAPTQYTAGDIPSFIRELLETKGKHRGYYPNYKNSKLEGIIDRNIEELSTSAVAIILPEGVKPTITDRDFVVATVVAPTVVVEPEKTEETDVESEAVSSDEEGAAEGVTEGLAKKDDGKEKPTQPSEDKTKAASSEKETKKK